MFSNAIRPAHRPGLILALALTIVAFGAQAENGLSFDQALRLAQDRSRQLVAQEAATTAAREMAVAAGQLPDPTLKAGIDNLPINGPDQFSLSRDFMTQRSIGVAQEFTREDKRKARATRFERKAENARLSGWVYVDIRGRDLRGAVHDMQRAVAEQVAARSPCGKTVRWFYRCRRKSSQEAEWRDDGRQGWGPIRDEK